MPLSGFSSVKRINFGDGNNWEDQVDPLTHAITYTCTQDDEITIVYETNPPPPETIPCPAGTVVTDSGSGAISVRTP